MITKMQDNHQQFRLEIELNDSFTYRLFLLVDKVNTLALLKHLMTNYTNIHIHEFFYQNWTALHGSKFFIDLDIDYQIYNQIFSLIYGFDSNTKTINDKFVDLDFSLNLLDKFIYENLFFNLKKVFIELFSHEITKKNYLVYLSLDNQMNSESKYGIHIVIDNCIVSNIRMCTYICNMLEYKLFNINIKFFDTHVYGTNSSLRIYGSKKTLAKGRCKMLAVSKDYKLTQEVVNLERNLLASLITYLDNSYTLLQLDENIWNLGKYKRSDGGNMNSVYSDIDEDLFENLMNRIKNCNINNFSLDKFNLIRDNNIIQLIRREAYHCPIHNRNHDNQNLFITISNTGTVFLKCFNDTSLSLFLFNLENTVNNANYFDEKYTKLRKIFDKFKIKSDKDMIVECEERNGVLYGTEKLVIIKNNLDGDNDDDGSIIKMYKSDLFNFIESDRMSTNYERTVNNNDNETFIRRPIEYDIYRSRMLRKVFYVKAPMKFGKTKLLIKSIREKYEDHYLTSFQIEPVIVIISFRITFTNELMTKLNAGLDKIKFISYQQISNENIDKYKYVIIQFESLHKFRNWAWLEKVDFLIFDESESDIEQGSSGLSSNIVETINTFKLLVSTATNILCMDANMSKRTHNVISSFTKNAHSLTIDIKAHSNTRYDIYKSFDDIHNQIDNSLKQGKNISIVANSKVIARSVYLDLIKKFPNKTVMLITGDLSKAEKKNIFGNVHENMKANILIYTPTLTAGVSFEIEHYDEVYGLYFTGSCNLETFIQMLGRIRTVNQFSLYFDNSYVHKTSFTSLSISDLDTQYSSLFRDQLGCNMDKNDILYIIYLNNVLINNLSDYSPFYRFLYLMDNSYISFFDNVRIITSDATNNISNAESIKKLKNTYTDMMVERMRELVKVIDFTDSKRIFDLNKKNEHTADEQIELTLYRLHNRHILTEVLDKGQNISKILTKLEYIESNEELYKQIMCNSSDQNNNLHRYVTYTFCGNQRMDLYKNINEITYMSFLSKLCYDIFGLNEIEFVKEIAKLLVMVNSGYEIEVKDKIGKDNFPSDYFNFVNHRLDSIQKKYMANINLVNLKSFLSLDTRSNIGYIKLLTALINKLFVI